MLTKTHKKPRHTLVHKKNQTVKTNLLASKSTYQDWETRLTKLLSSSLKNKSQKPLLGYPSARIMDKNKIIVVLDISLSTSDDAKEHITDIQTPTQIPLDKLKLWHIGDRRLGAVKYGFDTEKQILNYSAFDFGGLTNYKLPLGKQPEFLGNTKKITYNSPSIASAVSNEIFMRWCDLLGGLKMTPTDAHKIQLGINKVLKSIPAANLPVNIRFSKLPSERRLIIPAEEVLQETGHYYLRNYGNKSDADFATRIVNHKQLTNLFMGVSKDYITPNLNKFNIDYEYTSTQKRKSRQ